MSTNNASFLGGWYYNGQLVGGIADCTRGNAFAALMQSSDAPGILPLISCSELNVQSEGVYTCIIRDIDLMVHELEVGFYFNRGGMYLRIINSANKIE